jgi:phage host-nuclease inhibitor protein Gam
MTTEPSAKEPRVIESMNDVDSALRRLGELRTTITRKDGLHKEIVSALKTMHDESVKPELEEREQILETLADYLQRRRPALIRRFGKIIVRDNGEIKWYIRGPFADVPPNANELVQALLKIRGGKRFLIVKYEVDKKALAKASARMLRKLRPLGVGVGKNEYLSIRLPDEEKPTVIRKRRYPSRA